jgi:hypothetical protein
VFSETWALNGLRGVLTNDEKYAILLSRMYSFVCFYQMNIFFRGIVMALSDSPVLRRTRVNKRKVDDVKARYSDAQKIEAAKLWLVLGNATVVAGTLDMSLTTLKSWKSTKWWRDLIEDLRHEDSIKLSSRLKSIAERSFSLVEDRLEHGDYIYDQKSGSLKRKPMLGKDVARIAVDFVGRAVSLESKPREEESAVVGRLEDLAKRFEELAGKRAVQVTDVIFTKE